MNGLSATAASQVEILISSLRVEVIGSTTTIKVNSSQTKSYYLVSTPTDVWREFCRRQLECTKGVQP